MNEMEQMDLFSYLEEQQPKQAAKSSSRATSFIASFWRKADSDFQKIRGVMSQVVQEKSRRLLAQTHSLASMLKGTACQVSAFNRGHHLRMKPAAAKVLVTARRVRLQLKQYLVEFKMAVQELFLLSEEETLPLDEPESSVIDYLNTLMGIIPWVNVYKVTRAYGGPEQGGWYYRKYTCEKSVQVWRWDAEAAAAMYLRTYEKLAWGLLCSEADGLEVVVKIEFKPAQLERTSKPAYHPDLVIKSALASSGEVRPKEQGMTANLIKSNPGTSKAVPVLKNGKLLHFVRAARVEDEPCERCEGTGRTKYTHIENGRCFLCGGSGKKEDQDRLKEAKQHALQ